MRVRCGGGQLEQTPDNSHQSTTGASCHEVGIDDGIYPQEGQHDFATRKLDADKRGCAQDHQDDAFDNLSIIELAEPTYERKGRGQSLTRKWIELIKADDCGVPCWMVSRHLSRHNCSACIIGLMPLSFHHVSSSPTVWSDRWRLAHSGNRPLAAYLAAFGPRGTPADQAGGAYDAMRVLGVSHSALECA